jgi:hypothetical protein
VKKIAVMQPYFFPYLGYFQLAHMVDEFIFLDDVAFIKGGHINRNTILLLGQAHRFVMPVKDISSFRSIHDHYYLGAPQKFLDLLRHAYHKAPQFDAIYELVSGILSNPNSSVAIVNGLSITKVFEYLGLNKTFKWSSAVDPNSPLKGADRVIQLCRQRQASIYINAAGGRELYDPSHFKSHGLSLGFIQSRFAEYQQRARNFVAGLSIIDVLMWNSREQVVEMLADCSVDYLSSKESVENV